MKNESAKAKRLHAIRQAAALGGKTHRAALTSIRESFGPLSLGEHAQLVEAATKMDRAASAQPANSPETVALAKRYLELHRANPVAAAVLLKRNPSVVDAVRSIRDTLKLGVAQSQFVDANGNPTSPPPDDAA